MTSLAHPDTTQSAATDTPSASRFIAPALIGLTAAGLLFCGMAALQPQGFEGDAEQVDQAWARLRTLDATPPTLPPTVTRLHEKPPTPTPTQSAAPRVAAPRPLAPTPATAAPRLAQLSAPRDLVHIDPLLMGLNAGPAGSGHGPVLHLDPNGTALSMAGDIEGGGLLGTADPRALDAVLALGKTAGIYAPAANANRKPQWLQRIEPEYPPAALQQNQQGTVALRLRISPEGRVLEVQILSATCSPAPGAEAAFSQAASAAAQRSTFLPGTDSTGRMSEQWIKVSYVFLLR
ncbi:MAG TPA: TonB family protein [Planctomycetota bacterium]|nr:TonB family protein [Planctomycetota bacterium]